MTINHDDLLAKWTPLLRRLAGVSGRECGQKGYALMSLEILVDAKGEPVFWSEPRFTKLEPRLNAHNFLTEVLRMMGERVIAPE